MPRKKGDVSKSGPKSNIIEFILDNSGSVEESQIREHLKKKNEKTDQGNVNRYLHELRKELACIELETIKKGERKYNLWNITKLEHLKNIQFNFKDVIKLNKYEKALMIIFKNLGAYISTPADLKLYLRLLLIPSFFEFCMKMDPQTIYLRAWNYYRHDRGLIYNSIVNKHKDKYERINKEKVKNGDLPEFAIVNEIFLKILRELPKYLPEDSFELYGSYWESVEEKINKSSSNEDVKKSLNSLFTEYLTTIYGSGHLILLSDHFFGHDNIMLEDSLPEEIEFMEKTANNLKVMLESKRSHNDMKNWISADLDSASKIMAKYKQPNILNKKISDNPEEVKSDLIEHFSEYLKGID